MLLLLFILFTYFHECNSLISELVLDHRFEWDISFWHGVSTKILVIHRTGAPVYVWIGFGFAVQLSEKFHLLCLDRNLL